MSKKKTDSSRWTTESPTLTQEEVSALLNRSEDALPDGYVYGTVGQMDRGDLEKVRVLFDKSRELIALIKGDVGGEKYEVRGSVRIVSDVGTLVQGGEKRVSVPKDALVDALTAYLEKIEDELNTLGVKPIIL